MPESLIPKPVVTSPAPHTGAAGVPIIEIAGLSLYYGAAQALKNISLTIGEKVVTAFIGPSGCGKSTLLRCLNRMNDLIDNVRIDGTVKIAGQEIHGPDIDVIELRKRVGMVFQKANPFPTMSIIDNVLAGLRLNGMRLPGGGRDLAEHALRQAALWDEVKESLDRSGASLSGGQQQRLCIARTLALQPEVILMDEPCSALDPIATARVEELIGELRNRYTIVLVTHNMQQAARVADFTAFFMLGKLVEFGRTEAIFTRPRERTTEEYITGRFG